MHSQPLQVIAKEYVTRRKQFRKAKLRWRVSKGARCSLGWIPFNTGAATWKNGQVSHNGHFFKVWGSYGLADFKFLAGSFSEDARGRWYFNVAVDVKQVRPCGQHQVGIDLDLKTTATCSDGEKLQAGTFYRDLLPKLSVAQRANNKPRMRAIHAKIRNRRKDALHKFTTDLVWHHNLIAVGNISSTKLVKTKMALSVLDAGWGQLKTLLDYKCTYAGGIFRVVNEAYTSQTCSSCGSLPDTTTAWMQEVERSRRPESRPKGIAGLGR